MLNAELKSMNSILTYESFLSRCVRAGWRAVAILLYFSGIFPIGNSILFL